MISAIESVLGQEPCLFTKQKTMDYYMDAGYAFGDDLHLQYPSSHQDFFEHTPISKANQTSKKSYKHKIQPSSRIKTPHPTYTSKMSSSLGRRGSFRQSQTSRGLAELNRFHSTDVLMSIELPKIRALVLIDCQNSFLDAGGPFPINRDVQKSVVSNLVELIPRFRAAGGHIIFVKAIYRNLAAEPPAMAKAVRGTEAISSNAWLQVSTHVHPTSCCEAGLWNSDIYPEILAVAAPQDTICIKTYYSAFVNENSLLNVLQKKGVTEIYYGGVASGTCVLATILSATQLLPDIAHHAVTDIMGYSRPPTHVMALERLKALNVPCVLSTDI